MPRHSVGLLSDLEEAGIPIIQWQFSFNAWELITYELAAVCSQPHLVADVNVSSYSLLEQYRPSLRFCC